jgi:hypothetical protein
MQTVKLNSDIAIGAGMGFDLNKYVSDKLEDNLN